jgi:hypothetical protein
MIAAALEAEVDEYVASFSEEVGEDGKRLVVGNGQVRDNVTSSWMTRQGIEA